MNFRRNNITQYLIHEGLDVIGKGALLVDVKILSLVNPPDGVGMQVWCPQ